MVGDSASDISVAAVVSVVIASAVAVAVAVAGVVVATSVSKKMTVCWSSGYWLLVARTSRC